MHLRGTRRLTDTTFSGDEGARDSIGVFEGLGKEVVLRHLLGDEGGELATEHVGVDRDWDALSNHIRAAANVDDIVADRRGGHRVVEDGNLLVPDKSVLMVERSCRNAVEALGRVQAVAERLENGSLGHRVFFVRIRVPLDGAGAAELVELEGVRRERHVGVFGEGLGYMVTLCITNLLAKLD